MSNYDYLSSITGSSSLEGVNTAEKYYAMNLAKETMKSAFGDGMEFELVYQAFINSIENELKISSSNSSEIAGEDAKVETVDYNTYMNSLKLKKLSETSSDNSTSSMDEIYDAVNKYSKEYNVDPKLVLSIIKAESDFQVDATSSAGAKGLMQLMPSVCEQYNVEDPYDVDENIKGGVQLISQHLKTYNGDIGMMLMAYNAGAGTVASRGVTSINDLYKMPKETQNYCPKVLSYYNNSDF